MRERFPAVYRRGGLEEFSFKQRLAIRIADLAFHSLIRIIGFTLRYEIDNKQILEQLNNPERPYILALWHDRIFPGVYFLRDRGIAVLTSKSLDGEYIARFLTRFGFGAIRGSSSRGGVRGLVEMIKLMREGVPMAFTVDGPRGPRYIAKSGPVALSKKTGNPIIPFSVECRKIWRIKSWDRLQIPMPFSRARVFFAEPIFVQDEAGEGTIESYTELLQRALDDLTEKGAIWKQN